jgi:hypothetical protein
MRKILNIMNFEKLLKNYNLSIVLFLLFFFSWVGQGLFQYQEFVQNQAEHNQKVKMEEFWPEFWTATLENWQSEFLQLFTFVILTSFLIHKGSAESKDSDDEMLSKLNKIEKQTKRKPAKRRR